MMRSKIYILYWFFVVQAICVLCGDDLNDDYLNYLNKTDPAACQLYEFRNSHPVRWYNSEFYKMAKGLGIILMVG